MGRTMSYANYGLLVGTAMLVLISAHVKSAKMHEQPLDAATETDTATDTGMRPIVSMDHIAIGKQSVEDLAHPLPYQQQQQQQLPHGRQHKRVKQSKRQLHQHRRAYHSKYSIEQLLHMQVTPKVSNDIDMDPCKAGEWFDGFYPHFPALYKLCRYGMPLSLPLAHTLSSSFWPKAKSLVNSILGTLSSLSTHFGILHAPVPPAPTSLLPRGQTCSIEN